MFFRTRLVSFVSVLVAVCALAPATASAREGDHFSIEPGHRMVFICGWSYRPIAHFLGRLITFAAQILSSFTGRPSFGFAIGTS